MNLSRSVERVKKLRIDPISDDLVRFRSSLEDHSDSDDGPEVIHALSLEGTISLPDLTIRSVTAHASQQPYRECAASLEPMSQLVGLRVSSGFSTNVKNLLGGTAGCSHFMALALDLAGSHTLTMYLRMRERARLDQSDEENGDWTRVGLSIEPRLENACIALTSESRMIRQAKKLES
ncbi:MULTISPECIES: DUF2889 domain-containing protein [Paraburkholderia]|jgi:hypothetical protein|uniref:DUF2889 domain-containing protein n=1 Tax=Paraburkholderia madseniana TaxID=2599607 RepID=A0AAP5BI52_9BURK|nr:MULTISPECIES: DUF2889 domain-containing protein [Paraburkholderia]MCX4149975.1 DUF2889 domain-containing protein [Paraburkholderia madseniana]MDN7152911.1 DUF2889 domain-containing protein [Paraburkholderia sp. WS6]MDQ6411793.1 DUF2889 domain-containing protein [Paraburkholderia madseniana]